MFSYKTRTIFWHFGILLHVLYTLCSVQTLPKCNIYIVDFISFCYKSKYYIEVDFVVTRVYAEHIVEFKNAKI